MVLRRNHPIRRIWRDHKNSLLFIALVLTVLLWTINLPFLGNLAQGTRIWILTISFLFILPPSLGIAYSNFLSSRDLRSIFVTYLFLTFLIILLFGFGYQMMSVLSETPSIFGDEQLPFLQQNALHSFEGTVTSANDFLYFSSVTYFSLGYGDLYPVGMLMRALSQFEVFIGFVIHIFSAGIVIANLTAERRKVR